nr:MAG TPA_asm: hypothetical protein [Caudoviricetes sp.]DAS69809.1 MAG TPA: hypothetical protein [Caudoviricetes sp.]
MIKAYLTRTNWFHPDIPTNLSRNIPFQVHYI